MTATAKKAKIARFIIACIPFSLIGVLALRALEGAVNQLEPPPECSPLDRHAEPLSAPAAHAAIS